MGYKFQPEVQVRYKNKQNSAKQTNGIAKKKPRK